MTTEDGVSLRGHVALVTGSNRNIGRAIVLALAERGCDVIVNTPQHAEQAEAVAVSARARGVNVLVALGDVRRPEAVDALAREFGPHGVTVNAISAGPIELEHGDSAHAAHLGSQLARIPVGRLDTPADIATMCAYLCAPEAGSIAGRMIAIDGGTQT